MIVRAKRGESGAIRVTSAGKGKGSLADTLVTLPQAIPGTVIALALIISFPAMVGSFWILPLAYLIRTSPLLHRAAVAALRQVEPEVVDAAETLGAGVWRRWRTVILPLILPGLLSGVLLVLIAALGEFVSSVLLYSYSSRPISVEILASLRNLQFGVAAALSTLLLLLISVLVWLAGRFSDGLDIPVR